MLTSRQRVSFCLLKYVSCTSHCWRSLCSFHLYSYYLQWAWSRLATSMPVPPKWLQLKSLAISHHCRAVAVVCQAIIKKCTRRGGTWEWKLLPARPAGRMWGVQAAQQSYQSVAMGQAQPILSSLWERQIGFFPYHILKVDIIYVGMYHLNCIYDCEWEIGNMFYYEKQSVIV